MKLTKHKFLVSIEIDAEFSKWIAELYVREALTKYSGDPVLILGRNMVKVRRAETVAQRAAESITAEWGIKETARMRRPVLSILRGHILGK